MAIIIDVAVPNIFGSANLLNTMGYKSAHTTEPSDTYFVKLTITIKITIRTIAACQLSVMTVAASARTPFPPLKL